MGLRSDYREDARQTKIAEKEESLGKSFCQGCNSWGKGVCHIREKNVDYSLCEECANKTLCDCGTELDSNDNQQMETKICQTCLDSI